MSIKNKFPNIKPSLNLDFANTKRLDPRITFTRASTATYWDGVTQAKAEQNLLKYSQDFENAVWVNAEVTITANAVTAPDGTTTADTLTGNGVSGLHSILQTATTSTVGKAFSVYLKAGTNNFAQIFFDGDAAPFADFDLSTGTVGTTGGSVTATATAAGNGWYRCAVYTASTTATNPRVCLVSSSTAVRAESNSLSTAIYMWGAQLEQRSQATAYTPTTDKPITKYQPVLQTAASGVPRFDHNPVTGESLGLLIEVQRTNLLTYSSDLSDAAWTKTNTTVDSNSAIAPDGTPTGDKLVAASGSAAHGIIISVSSPANSAISVYAKYAGQRFIQFHLGQVDQTRAWVNFDILDGVVGTINGAATSATIAYVGNGWYRCSFLRTGSGNVVAGVYIAPSADAAFAAAATGDGYSGIYIWGAQLEDGVFPTSYIPTTTAQVTCAADTASMTGTNFSSWYRQDAGTVYTEYMPRLVSGGVAVSLDASASRRFIIYDAISSLVQNYYIGASGPISLGTAIEGSSVKVAASFDVAASSGCMNGSSIAVGAQGIQAASRMCIGSENLTSNTVNSTIRKVAYYPLRLTDSQLQALTA